MKKKKVILIGSGGHSKVLLDILKKELFKVIGFVDKNKKSKIKSYKYLGNDNKILDYSPKKVLLVNCLGYTNKTNIRKKIFENLKKKKYIFLTLKHEECIVSKNVKCLEGSQIMAGSVIQPGCIIGKNSIINTSASIDHDCIIGDNVHIAPASVLCGNVTIGNNSFIGAGTIIVPNINVPANTLIKAGQKILK